MKNCACGRPCAKAGFGVKGDQKYRTTCANKECVTRSKIKDPDKTPPAAPAELPSAPPPDPLAAAYKMREERDSRKQEKAQLNALIDENRALRERIDLLQEVKASRPEIIVYDKPKDERADAIAMATASDWHCEEPVDRESVHGLNEYNLEVCRSRSMEFFRNSLRLTEMAARDSNIRQLHTNYLGDFISGHIHEELLSSSLLNPGEAITFCAGLIISGIEYQLANSDFVLTGDMVPGNHGRMTKQVWHSDPTGTSLETLMYQMITAHFKDNPRVKLNVSHHAMVYRKFFEKFTMRLIHGYEVNYGGGVGGITIPLNKAISQWDVAIKADLTVLGHFHQYLPGQRFLVNGSLIGYNTYAQAIKASYEEARQAWALIHARGGGQTCLHAPIWLERLVTRGDVFQAESIAAQ